MVFRCSRLVTYSFDVTSTLAVNSPISQNNMHLQLLGVVCGSAIDLAQAQKNASTNRIALNYQTLMYHVRTAGQLPTILRTRRTITQCEFRARIRPVAGRDGGTHEWRGLLSARLYLMFAAVLEAALRHQASHCHPRHPYKGSSLSARY